MTDRADHLATPLGLLSWRPRTDADQGLLRALFASYRQAELALMGGDAEQQQAFVDLQLRARDHHRDATRPDADLAVVTLDGVAVGQLDVHRTDEAVEVLEIALIPGLRGHGLGTALLVRVIEDADEAAQPVRLHVEPANPALRLYQRLGFAVVGTEPMHLAMERPVGGAPVEAPAEPEPEEPEVVAPPGPAPAPGDADVHHGEVTHLEVPTYDQLAPHLGATVTCLPDGPDLELVEVEARPGSGLPGRMPYTAVLTGPEDAPLPQGVHRLDLPPLGPADLFIVPIGVRDGCVRYELVVS